MKNKEERITKDDIKTVYDSSEKLALQIRMLSRAMKKISTGSLKQGALVILLHESSGVGKPDIRKILEAMDNLERNYLRPEKVNQ